MFEQLINADTVLLDVPILLKGQIVKCEQLLGEGNSLVREAKNAVQMYGQASDRMCKTGLLELWKDKCISFGAKCLVTIWWGRPNYRVLSRVYSDENVEMLRAKEIERLFNSLFEEKDFDTFREGLEILYTKFSRHGDFHLDGIGVSFFTKIFHFYFASHPPKSNPNYLPVIADDILRMAVFAELIDREEGVNEVFYVDDASLRSYVRYVDKFNTIAKDYRISPFVLEDIVFNLSKGLGLLYVAGYNGHLSLPHWISGTYNAKEQVAIVFNNLIGETYLFEGVTARLWDKLLKYDYEEGIRIEELLNQFGCSRFELLSFMKQLKEKTIIIDHTLSERELDRLKRRVNRTKKRFLTSNKGVGDYHSSYESVDNDYRNRTVDQGIPFAASIELTYACNEACIHCYNPNSPRQGGEGTVKERPHGEMQEADYFKVLEDMKRLGVAKIIFTGGDPFMKNGLLNILKYAHKLKFAFSLYTNGQALYANRLLYEEIRELYPQYIGLSLYSTIPEVHDGITRRKGSCEKTKEVARWCSKDAIGLQIKCPIMQANMNSYDKVFDFAIGINGIPQFDVNITSGVDGDCFASQRLRLKEEQFEVVLKDSRIPLSIENSVGVIVREPDMMFCGAGSSNFNIQPDGTVTPCNAFPLNCGNIKEDDLESIWRKSSNLKSVRCLRYGDSDICGKEAYCKYCNRCLGQSFVEHGKAENHSEDNCFIAKIRYRLASRNK